MSVSKEYSAVLLFLLLSVGGCVVSETRLPEPIDYQPRAVREIARWTVTARGELVGHLVKLAIRDPGGPIEFFRVENDQEEWVGHVTPSGRFSRRVPFQDNEEVVGIYGMKEGLGLLFDTTAPLDLAEVTAVEASDRRSP